VRERFIRLGIRDEFDDQPPHNLPRAFPRRNSINIFTPLYDSSLNYTVIWRTVH
jgi:hypothetical protein